MKQEKTIFQAKYNVLLENSGVNSLQREVKSLKTKIEEYKSQLSETKYYYDEIQAKYDELKLKTDMQTEKSAAVIATDTFTQTEPMTGATFVEQMDWDRVNKRAETYKTEYQNVVRTYNGLKESYIKLRTEHEQTLANSNDLTKRMNQLQLKYDATKEICNNRFKLLKENDVKIAESERQIAELEVNEAKLKEEMVALKQMLEKGNHEQCKLDYDELKEQYSKNIKICSDTAKTLDDIKRKYGDLKSENDSRRQQLMDSEDRLNALTDKYVRLKKQKSELEYLEVYRSKYQLAKELLAKRLGRMHYLQDELKKHGILFTAYSEKNNENVSNNTGLPKT